ncbi:MAG: phytanoyl-CoA dioxygenase family protein [Armatimonadetes bacterium]|nr:phytanoyl-CoA dioxygenase family protein [Armatimonadota bacterium]
MAQTIDSIASVPYDSALYAPEALITPIPTLDDFNESMLDQYRELGFVSVGQAFSPEKIDAARTAIVDLVNAPVAEGMELQFESEAKDIIDTLKPEEKQDYVRKFMWFSHLNQATMDLMYDPELIRVVEMLLGGECEMFQDMALLKPPGIGREKPWHQDHAYFNIPEGTKVVGVWIALDDTYPENGCMHFMPGGHKAGPVRHWNRRDWQICDSDVLGQTGQVATPLPTGGCLIFDGLTPHGTPTNKSQARRRALQYHYVLKGTPRISTEERINLFGTGGENATC